MLEIILFKIPGLFLHKLVLLLDYLGCILKDQG